MKSSVTREGVSISGLMSFPWVGISVPGPLQDWVCLGVGTQPPVDMGPGIQSASRWYTSYWNAFLLTISSIDIDQTMQFWSKHRVATPYFDHPTKISPVVKVTCKELIKIFSLQLNS